MYSIPILLLYVYTLKIYFTTPIMSAAYPADPLTHRDHQSRQALKTISVRARRLSGASVGALAVMYKKG